MNVFLQRAVSFRNEAMRCTGALVGIVQGILSDGALSDEEIAFLRSWLRTNSAALQSWPGNVIAAQIDDVLVDGFISPTERAGLLNTLQQLIGGSLDELAASDHVTDLAIDRVEAIEIVGRSFCFSGAFLLGSRSQCQSMIEAAGGSVTNSVSRKLDYLVLGGLGSTEWKHGSFGTKVEKAMSLKQNGAALKIIHEDPFATTLMTARRGPHDGS